MCAATRFPEAVPLRKITASSVVKALAKFFSTLLVLRRALIVTEPSDPSEDGLETHSAQSPRLPNSEMLEVLPKQLGHLTPKQQCDVLDLIDRFPCLFSDVPTRTTIL